MWGIVFKNKRVSILKFNLSLNYSKTSYKILYIKIMNSKKLVYIERKLFTYKII